MRPRSSLLLGSLLAVLAAPASALAGTVSLVPEESRSFGMEPTDPNLLSFTAKPGERNHVTGSYADDAWRFRDTTATITPGKGCERVDDHEAACPRPPGRPFFGVRVHVRLGDRDDVFTSEHLTVEANGGTGSDVLTGAGGHDVLDGGGGGRDELHGEGSRDWLRDGDTRGHVDSDLLDGGANGAFDDLRQIEGLDQYTDLVSYRARARGVRVDLTTGRAGLPGEGDRLVGIEGALGTSGHDVLIGDDDANLLGDDLYPVPTRRATGSDTIRAGGGADLVRSYTGADRVSGEAGDDVLQAGWGAARLYGDSGVDTVRGGSGTNRLSGGPGADVLATGFGRERASGDTGNDLIFGSRGRQWLRGGDGDDTLTGILGADRLDGGAGDDTLTGDRSRTYRYQPQEHPGADRLDGGPGRDTLYGGPADDTLYARDGERDSVDGGTGRDRARVDAVDARTSIEALF